MRDPIVISLMDEEEQTIEIWFGNKKKALAVTVERAGDELRVRVGKVKLDSAMKEAISLIESGDRCSPNSGCKVQTGLNVLRTLLTP